MTVMEQSSSTEQLMPDLHIAHFAFVQGTRLWRWKKDPNTDDSEIAAGLMKAALDRMGKLEVGTYWRSRRATNDTLALCRSNRVDEGGRLVTEAIELVNARPIAAEASLLCLSMLAPARAYYLYRCGEHEEADHSLDRARECDQTLEDVFGHRFLHVHRLHMIENSMQMRIVARDYGAALELGTGALCYMGRVLPDPGVPGKWGEPYLRACPVLLLRQKAVQFAAKLGEALLQLGHGPAMGHVCERLDRCADTACVGGALSEPVCNWMRATSALLRGNRREFLASIALVLADGPAGLGALWFASLLQFATFASQLGPDVAPITAELRDWVRQCRAMPRGLRTMSAAWIAAA